MQINMLVTLDANYLPPLCTMLESLAENQKNDNITLYVAHSSLEEVHFEQIRSALENCSASVVSVRLGDELFENAPVKKRISKETYYRMFAPFYLDKSIERIIYIDPDTLILNPLNSFYEADMTGCCLCGAKHFDGAIDLWNRKRLFMNKSKRYINAGVLLMNLKEMRNFTSRDDILSLVRKKKSILFLADQDALNILYDGKMCLYDENIINLDERCFARLVKKMGEKSAFEYINAHTAIVHYNGKYKPWKPYYHGLLDVLYPSPDS